MEFSNYLWLFTVGLGPFILAAFFIWALLRRRRLSAIEKARSHRGTEEVYREQS